MVQLQFNFTYSNRLLTWLCALLCYTYAAPSIVDDSFCSNLCASGGQNILCDCNIYENSLTEKRSESASEACGTLCHYGMGGSACDCNASALGKLTDTTLSEESKRARACDTLCFYGMGGSACECNASALGKKSLPAQLMKRGPCSTLCYYGMGGSACNCNASALGKRNTDSQKRGETCYTLCYYGLGGRACNCNASAISKRGFLKRDVVGAAKKDI